MQRTRLTTLILIVTLTSVAAAAQMTPPTPAPELKKLDYFNGTWSTEATIPAGPWGSGGKFTASGTNEWMRGDFFLVGHSDFASPAELGGSGTAISIIAYASDKKVRKRDLTATATANSGREPSMGIPGHGLVRTTTAG